jgi:hypothetical protein
MNLSIIVIGVLALVVMRTVAARTEARRLFSAVAELDAANEELARVVEMVTRPRASIRYQSARDARHAAVGLTEIVNEQIKLTPEGGRFYGDWTRDTGQLWVQRDGSDSEEYVASKGQVLAMPNLGKEVREDDWEKYLAPAGSRRLV